MECLSCFCNNAS